MGGFLDGLKTLAGGWSDVRQIDKDGFDFREKRAAQQAARDQDLQQYQQANEDWATKAATEADLGGAEPDAIEGMIPGNVNKALTLARMKGLGLQSKSALEAAKAQNKYWDRQTQQQNDLEKITARADEVEALTKMKNGLPISPTDQAKIEAAAARTGQTIEGMLKAVGIREAGADRRKESGGGDEKPLYRYTTNQNGEAGTVLVFPGGREEFHGAAPTVTMRDTSGMAGTIAENIKDLKAAADPTNEGGGVTAGPIMGRISKIKQSMYPEGNEGVFDAKANQLVDIVYLKSGKQINQNEMKILSSMIPNRAKGNVDFQIQQFEDYANGLLRKYGKSTGGPASPASGGQHGPPVRSGINKRTGKRVYQDAEGRRWEE